MKDGKCVCAYSRKKVIISAGINSPQLLMLCGIGPAKVLKKAGIPIVVDNPNVGQRLKNHTADEGFLTDPDDMEAIKRIYRIYIRNIAQELARIDSSYKLLSPTLDIIDNDDRLEQFIKDNFDHNHHQQEFLRMAPLSKGGVVNRRGEVHGVQNLIVADASIVPFTVDGNTSSAAYLIGYTIANQLCKKPIRKKINRHTWNGKENDNKGLSDSPLF